MCGCEGHTEVIVCVAHQDYSTHETLEDQKEARHILSQINCAIGDLIIILE